MMRKVRATLRLAYWPREVVTGLFSSQMQVLRQLTAFQPACRQILRHDRRLLAGERQRSSLEARLSSIRLTTHFSPQAGACEATFSCSRNNNLCNNKKVASPHFSNSSNW